MIEGVSIQQKEQSNSWRKMVFERACRVRVRRATTSRLKAFGKPSNVKWLISAISHSKKPQEQLLIILNSITIQKDCIRALDITFLTIFSLFFLSTNLDKFLYLQGFALPETAKNAGEKWLPCVKGAGSAARRRLRDCPFAVFCLHSESAEFFNPSVTALPCHLPLHRGGKMQFIDTLCKDSPCFFTF